MATLVIKNLPEDLHARLKAQAQLHHRSVTREAVHLIETGLASGVSRPTVPSPIRLKSGFRPSVEEVEAAIAEGQS